MIITITGANDFARKAELHRLVQEFVAEHTDMAVERFDSDETDAARMRESIASLPFLTARKLVLLHEPGKQKAFAEAIADVVNDAPETTDVIIVEPKLDKRLSYYKTLKKATDFRDFTELDAVGLASWASDYVKERSGNMQLVDARFLIDRVGSNQQLLKQELDKLLNYDPTITKATIELLCETAPQSTIFELLDAAFSGNTKRMLELYKEQRALKVEPQAIIAMLAWQLHILAIIKAAGPRSIDDIARSAKLNPFVVRKSQNLIRNLATDKLREMVAGLLDLDIKLKSTAIDADEVLQLYMLRVSS
jgi:DNA polymerase III delta subunit